MKGSKPRSSSACAAAAAEEESGEERSRWLGARAGPPGAGPAAPKPNAACQSVVDDTGILSGISSGMQHNAAQFQKLNP
jgi:hypothetical protein